MLSTDAYIALLRESETLITALPFEHVARNRSFKDFVSRLVFERDSLLGAQADKAQRRFFLVVGSNDAEAARQVWRLQSVPYRGVLRLDRARTRAETAPTIDADGVMTAALGQTGELPDWISNDDYLIPFALGDTLHPALGTTLALRVASGRQQPPSVWTWNATGFRVSDVGYAVPACFLRKPERPDATWLAADVTGRALAVSAGAFRRIGSQEILREFTGDTHSFIRALISAGVDWQHHPEYLGLYPADSWCQLMAPVAADIQAGLAAPLLGGAHCERQANMVPMAYRPAVWPSDAGRGVSVIIPFRDRVDLTLEAARSAAKQTTSTWIEIVLVNNQSRREELQMLHAGLAPLLRPDLKAVVIDYPRPFNHSRQCNLGAEAATGSTLVFLNNDATLDSEDALESFARWSGLPGVITVSGRIVDKKGELQCSGLRARQNPGTDFNSPMEEGKDDVLAQGLKRVSGNSFACAAVRRDRFIAAGRLDEVEFPIGYNDIEFSLRTSGQGLSHLYLGWVQISHAPGGSRGSSDEMLQKVLLRDRHPEVLRASQYQLEGDANILKMAIAKATLSAQAPAAARLSDWWKRSFANASLSGVAVIEQERG